MKMPSKCFCCKDIMLSEYSYEKKYSCLRKTCGSKLDHYLVYKAHLDSDDTCHIMSLQYRLYNLCAVWNFNNSQLIVSKNDSQYKELIFFNPEGLLQAQILQKLKTFIIMS